VAGFRRVKSVVAGEPSKHLCGGVLQRLVKGPRVADREDEVRGLAARPANPWPLSAKPSASVP
jgi:hypothetical protein